jgi:hypothetical protein
VILIEHDSFSTARVLTIPPGADPSAEPLLTHAGVLVEDGGASSSWDGVTTTSPLPRRFVTTTRNDLTAPELVALANLVSGRTNPVRLPEAAYARVRALHEEVIRFLGSDPAPEGP